MVRYCLTLHDGTTRRLFVVQPPVACRVVCPQCLSALLVHVDVRRYEDDARCESCGSIVGRVTREGRT